MLLVSLVLVIASSNLAGVQLARTDARRREMAVRLAIGAGRGRLTRQLLTETVVLFLLGGAAGVLLARGAASIVLLLLPALPMPANLSLALDGRVVAFAAALSVIAALLTGLGPALHASRADIVRVLKGSEQGPSDGLRLRTAFVVTQVAFSILLVVLAGLLVRGFGRVSVVDRGFDPRGVEVAEVDLSMAGYTDATGPAFATQLLERIRQVPGVRAATIADRAPAPGRFMGMLGEGLTVPGAAPTAADRFTPNWTIVAPGYFATIGLPLVAGRDFSGADTAIAEPVVIVTAATARLLWPGQDAVGRHILWHRPGLPGGPATITQARVIGVASDLKSEPRASAASVQRDGERAIAVTPVSLYAPVLQQYRPRLSILARGADGRGLATRIRHAVTTMDPDLTILAAQTLDDQLAGPVEIQLRVAASISTSLGLIGLVLAAIGVYGVTAYAVTRRTREIGVRLALGARPADVTRMVLRHGLLSLAIGSITGLALAAGAGRLLSAALHGVPPLDPLAFAGSAALFAAVGIGACYVPVRRAVRINAMEALRCE
jgi:predicted permease